LSFAIVVRLKLTNEVVDDGVNADVDVVDIDVVVDVVDVSIMGHEALKKY
jgi:hypothetical protein